jgi:hypothetical protein
MVLRGEGSLTLVIIDIIGTIGFEANGAIETGPPVPTFARVSVLHYA